MRIYIFILLSTFLFLFPSQAGEENDLWLLLSSYEDIGITVNDLAFFLATHGYNAQPEQSYVTVKFPGDREVYLTPNGGDARLADLWMEPPTEKSGPIQVIPTGAIDVNVTYNRSENEEFIKTVSRYTMFPVTPLGMCYDGSQQLEEIYKSFGYNIRYMYDPSGFDSQGHLWVTLEDDHSDRWLAVDSYYGVMADDDSYYHSPYSFEEFKYLDSINPKWNLA
jgi:hypothetical protein